MECKQLLLGACCRLVLAPDPVTHKRSRLLRGFLCKLLLFSWLLLPSYFYNFLSLSLRLVLLPYPG